MTAQKIPLFDGLIQPCHDGIGVAEELTPVFTPPDKTAPAGTQSFYLLHLWIKAAAAANFDEGNPAYRLQAYRGSNTVDKRPLWGGSAVTLQQATIKVDGTLLAAQSGAGIPIKILDGYPVRGDVFIELVSYNAHDDFFAFGEGTRLWGYYQRVGEENEPIRFIGEPPAGPLFDTGLPVKIAPAEYKTLHTFQPDKIDDIRLQLAVAELETTHLATFIFLAGADPLVGLGGNTSTVSIFPDAHILGAANALRDPKSPSGFQGVFGNNPLLKTLRALNQDATRTVYIHGRFARH